MKKQLLIFNLLLAILFLGTIIIRSTPKIMRAQIEATATPIGASFEDHLTSEWSDSEQVTSLQARRPSTTPLPLNLSLPSDMKHPTMTLRPSNDEIRVPEGCYEYLDNGGFEYNSAWYFDSYPNAGYSNFYASAGNWSAYLSTYSLGMNQYPWMWQTVTIPAEYESITIYYDTMAVFADPGDTVYLGIYDQSGTALDFGIVTYSAIDQWYSWSAIPEVDLSGQTINLTYLIEHDNDQYYSEVNFDQVSLVICEGSTPATSTPRPATSTPRPATSTPRSATSTPRPATSTPRSATNTPRPATSTPRATATRTPRPTGSINLSVDSVEISQAIQRTNNSVPLVANRPAIMRLFVDVENTSSAVNGVTARLHAARNGTELSNSPIAPFNSGGSFRAPLSPSRSDFGNSLNFQLPTNWTSAGELTLWVEVNPERTVAESNYGDNRSQNQTFTFQSIPPLEVVLIPIAYQRNGRGALHRPNMNASNNFGLGMLQRIYPIASMQYTIHPEYSFKGDMSTEAGWSQLLKEIKNLRARELPNRSQMSAGGMPKYYGVLPMEAILWGGLGYRPGTASIGLVAQDDVAAHEIGHNVGLPHVNCGGPSGIDSNYPYPGGLIGNVGIDVYQRELISASTHQDLMSYCWPKWLSDYNYRKIFDVLARASRQPSNPQEPQAGWLISGRIYPDGTGSLDNAEPILSSAVVEEPGLGLYDIELLDQSDVVQFRYSFNPIEIAQEDETPLPSDFAFVVPQLENLGRIQLKQGGNLLATLDAAAAPPDVKASQSAASSGDPDDVTISWGVGANARGSEQIKVNLRYSADGGVSWQTLAVGLTDSSLDLALSQLPASQNGLLEVIATNSTQSQSRRLELGQINNKAPQVGILNNGETIQLYPREPLILDGVALDLEDASITGNDLAWSEATLGQLGTGQTLILAEGLEAGSYTINLTATDSEGDSTSDSLTVIVAEGVGDENLYLPIITR